VLSTLAVDTNNCIKPKAFAPDLARGLKNGFLPDQSSHLMRVQFLALDSSLIELQKAKG